jgi:uncharacterized membrane protein YdbT with pleckstrin-like domain
MADITFACPHCEQHIEADDAICGQTVECPSCQGEIIVPEKPKPAPKVASIIPSSSEPEPDDPEDEHTLFTEKPAMRAYLGRMIGAGIWSAIGIVVLLVIKFNAFASIVLPPLVIGGITALGIWIETHSTEYKLTTQRFFLKKGLIAKHVDELELFRVKDVTVDQGIIQRMLGFGSVMILSTDDSTPKIVMHGIAKPTEVKELIRKTHRVARKKERVHAAEFIAS